MECTLERESGLRLNDENVCTINQISTGSTTGALAAKHSEIADGDDDSNVLSNRDHSPKRRKPAVVEEEGSKSSKQKKADDGSHGQSPSEIKKTTPSQMSSMSTALLSSLAAMQTSLLQAVDKLSRDVNGTVQLASVMNAGLEKAMEDAVLVQTQLAYDTEWAGPVVKVSIRNENRFPILNPKLNMSITKSMETEPCAIVWKAAATPIAGSKRSRPNECVVVTVCSAGELTSLWPQGKRKSSDDSDVTHSHTDGNPNGEQSPANNTPGSTHSQFGGDRASEAAELSGDGAKFRFLPPKSNTTFTLFIELPSTCTSTLRPFLEEYDAAVTLTFPSPGTGRCLVKNTTLKIGELFQNRVKFVAKAMVEHSQSQPDCTTKLQRECDRNILRSAEDSAQSADRAPNVNEASVDALRPRTLSVQQLHPSFLRHILQVSPREGLRLAAEGQYEVALRACNVLFALRNGGWSTDQISVDVSLSTSSTEQQRGLCGTEHFENSVWEERYLTQLERELVMLNTSFCRLNGF